MSSSAANAWRSSVEGKAVRWYVSFKTFSCVASALLRFFLTVGSSCEGTTASLLNPADWGVAEERAYGCASLIRGPMIRSAEDWGPTCVCGCWWYEVAEKGI
jgi:hypothetical protein